MCTLFTNDIKIGESTRARIQSEEMNILQNKHVN